jgi:hypothetical protein
MEEEKEEVPEEKVFAWERQQFRRRRGHKRLKPRPSRSG